MKKLAVVSFFIFILFISLSSQTISSLGVSGQYYDIRSDNNGTIHLLWIDDGIAKYGQIVNRQVVNQITIGEIEFNEVNYRKVRPRLSVKPDGTEVHFVWVTPLYQSTDLMHCWRNSAGTWVKEKIYTASGTYKYNLAPTFAADSSGVWHAAVIEDNGSNVLHPVAYFRKAVGGAWTRMTNLAPATKEHLWPNLFTDTNGNVHITWDMDKDFIQYRYAPSGGDLSTATTITLPRHFPHNKQSEVFADASGNVYVAALSYPDGGTPGNIDYWIKPAGGNFSSGETVSGTPWPLEGYFAYPAVIARSPSLVAVSWAEALTPSHPATVRASVYNGEWTLYTLSPTANFKTDTRTAMAMDNSSAYLIWRENDTNRTIYLATFDYAVSGLITPNGGQTWEWGATYDINWSLEDATGNIAIHLYKNDVDLGPIVSDTPDDGSYSWTINTLESGALIQNGNDYKIEVKAIDGSDSDISDSNFTISTVFRLLTPDSSSVWTAGQNYNITWTSTQDASPNIKINVFKDTTDVSNFVEQLTGPNNGLYSWTIPASYEEGNYIMRLKTDDSLLMDDSDLFSIVVDPTAPPSITVTNPGSGNTWYRNSTYNITWTKTGEQSDNVNVYIYKDSVGPSNLVEQMTGPNSGSYSWMIPETYADGNHLIRIETDDAQVSGDSSVFYITGDPGVPSAIAITSPTASDTWNKNSTYNITWSRAGVLSANVKVNIFLNSTDPSNFVQQLTGPNTGSLSWTIPGTYANGSYIMRIKTDDSLVFDDSDLFTIIDGGSVTPTITVNSPAAGSTWFKSHSYNITWSATGTQTANVNIDVYRNTVDPLNFIEQITTVNDGTHNWVIPATYSDGNYIIRIETTDAAIHGDSGTFNITGDPNLPPSITITSPTASDSWNKSSTYNITWNKTGTMSENIKINIFMNTTDPSNFVQQLTGPNTGSLSWTIPGTYANGSYIMRIKTDDSLVFDDSDLFTITDGGSVTPTITVNSPAAGSNWYKSYAYNISWSTTGTQTSNVNIDVYQDAVDPSNFIEQITTANDGTHNWTIPGTYSDGNYIMRIETTDSVTYGDSGVFNISSAPSATMTVISPAACSTWSRNYTYVITWLKDGSMSENVEVDIYRDTTDPSNFVQQLTGPNSGSIIWTIPSYYEDGNYIVKITTDNGLVSDESGLFSINGNSISSPGIIITSPESCDTWTKQTTYKISWVKNGSMSANVKVNIFRNSVDPSNFIQQLTGPNTGSINWTIPETYTDGNYVIRVKTDDSRVYDDSGIFVVSGTGTVTPTLIVNSPGPGVSWYRGQSNNITWSTTGTQTANVNIEVYHDSVDPSNFIEQITTSNDGTHNWTVPEGYIDGSYVIRIETTDETVYGDSGVFNITGDPNLPPSITITSPASGDTWNKNNTYDIKWNKTGTMSSNVKVNIFRNTTDPANFVQQLTGPNTGSISWTIPGTYVNGSYIMRIKTDDSAVYGDSSIFEITD